MYRIGECILKYHIITINSKYLTITIEWKWLMANKQVSYDKWQLFMPNDSVLDIYMLRIQFHNDWISL